MPNHTEYKIVRRHGGGRVLVRFYRTVVGEPFLDETGLMVTPVSRTFIAEREYHLLRYTDNDILDFLDHQLPAFVTPGWPVLPSQETRQPRELSVIRQRDIQASRKNDSGD